MKDHDTDMTDIAGQFQRLSNIDMSDADTPETDDTENGNDDVANEFKQRQREDKTLESYWQRASNGSHEFKIFGGLLYKRAPPNRLIGTHEFLLIVPQTHQTELIRIAHDLPASGHQGIRKTLSKISTHFFFPKMKLKISKYVKECHVCQMMAPKQKSERAPLQPISVMEKPPFFDISIDILGGDLPATARKNKYLLTIVCNTTRWVHAVPLTNLRAHTIAEKLVEFFSFVGISQTVRLDNMASFRSEIFTALRERLGIDASFSAPYHFESHGKIERANRTIGEMLRKFMMENKTTWDNLIVHLLMVLRESKNDSTGFSPAQLVFGREFRGLLAVARESWEKNEPRQHDLKKPTVEYLEELNSRIEAALRAAGQNDEAAQVRMKLAYDKASSNRELQPDELALILLPSQGNKMLCSWRGPYKVLERCENNNYVIDVEGRRAKLHINQLRRYHERPDEDVQCVNMIIDDVTEKEAETGVDNEQQCGQQGATPGGFHIGSQLTPQQQSELDELLGRYGDVFSDTPGTTHLVEHRIRVTDNLPCYQPSYRIPEAMRDQVEEELTNMLEQGIIQRDYETNYNSPLIVVKKPGGKIRLVNNFVQLNSKTINEQYTMTNQSELLNRAAGFKYLSKIDLGKAFWQVKISPESQPYTGFQTFMGPFCYRKLAMGLRCASATFQRLMDKVLCNMHKFAGTLIDDTLIYSTTFQDHLEHVKMVLDRLREAGLTANKEKCSFAVSEIGIFGFLVKDGKIYPSDDKVAAIAAWKPPKTKKQLKSFIGLTSYFRGHVDRYATIAYPLTDKLKGNSPDRLLWGTAEQAAFEQLKRALMSKPVVRPPDIKRPFLIMTDAAKTTISGVLLQPSDNEGTANHVVAYASRKLLEREEKFPVIERELLAIIFSLLKFKHYIYGSNDIRVYTDHRPLIWLNSLMKHSPRLTRWALILMEFNIITTYVKGEDQLADHLTRLK